MITGNTTVTSCKFCSIFHPFSPAASLPTKCKLDSYTDSKTVHYKPPPVYGQVICTCRKSLACCFEDKKDKHLNYSAQQTVIQRKYTFFCPQTSKMYELFHAFWKSAWKSPIHLPSGFAHQTSIIPPWIPWLLQHQQEEPKGMLTSGYLAARWLHERFMLLPCIC